MPVLRAVVVGLAVALLVALATWRIGRWLDLDGEALHKVVGGWASSLGCVSLCVSAIAFVLPERVVLETGEAPEPQQEPEASGPEVRTRVVVESEDGSHSRWFELPVSDEKMRRVARAVLWQGRNFSRPVLADELGILTQGEYNKLAQALEDGQVLVKKANNQRELLAVGRRLLRRFM